MYIDIGAEKYGFLHVKELSGLYYVESPKHLFKIGDDIDGWVHQVDVEKQRMRLSMRQTLDLSDIRVPRKAASELQNSQLIRGVVTKASPYGVYVDVEYDNLAFLPKRFMNFSIEQRYFQTWEMYPIGSVVEAYVCKVPKNKDLILITTYQPSVQDVMLPMKYSNQYDVSQLDLSDKPAVPLPFTHDTTEEYNYEDIIDDSDIIASKPMNREAAVSTGAPSASNSDRGITSGAAVKAFHSLRGSKAYVHPRDVQSSYFFKKYFPKLVSDETSLYSIAQRSGAFRGRMNVTAFESFITTALQIYGEDSTPQLNFDRTQHYIIDDLAGNMPHRND